MLIKTEAITFPVYSFPFWREYFIQMRPYLLFVSGIAGLSGIALSADESTPLWKIVTAFVPFFLGYGFGQALTDCFQRDTDKLSAPYRPLSRGTISVASVLTVSLSGLALSGVLLFFLQPMSFALSIICVFGLATYTYVKKNAWFAGPFYNAWIVALLPVMGYLTTSATSRQIISQSVYTGLGATVFSYGNFVLIGYLKDIEADRLTGYKTFPVVFGWTKTVITGDVFALAMLVLFWWGGGLETSGLLFGVAGSAIIIYGQISAHLTRRQNEKGALIPILSTVRCFVLLHIAMVTSFQPGWSLFGVVFYLLFEVTLFLRPSKYQV